MPRSKNESTAVAPERNLSGCLRCLETMSIQVLHSLKRIYVAEELGAIGLVRLTPLPLKLVHQVRDAAVDLVGEISSLCVTFEAAIAAALQAAHRPMPDRRWLVKGYPFDDNIVPHPHARPDGTIDPRPPLEPLLTCPNCGAVALAKDFSNPAVGRYLARGAKQAKSFLDMARQSFARHEVRKRLKETEPSKLASEYLEPACQTRQYLTDLVQRVDAWRRKMDEILTATERALDPSLLPTCVLGLEGLLPFPGQEPCPHLVQIGANWVHTVKRRRFDGQQGWTKPNYPVEGYADDQLLQQDFKVGGHKPSPVPPRFGAVGRGWFSVG